MKLLKILLIMFLLLVSIVFADSLLSLNLPLIEHGCYTKYADNSQNYSFILNDGNPLTNITELNEQKPHVKHILIKSYSDMCRYSLSPTKCYDCITLKKYGANVTEQNLEDKSQIPFPKIILGIVIIILLAFLIYQFIPKSKAFKTEKK
ncbi:hypothetical protein HYU23_01590 [Candidatus Woesearchaeota archaeon]|nr:hypothetical protein [Candidatus Woesearchaeota archaeon]